MQAPLVETFHTIIPDYLLADRYRNAASVKRHCLEKGDEQGASGDLNNFQSSASSSAAGVDEQTNIQGDTPVSSSSLFEAAECEALLEGICAGVESILSPLWAQEIEGVSGRTYLVKRKAEAGMAATFIQSSL